MSIGGSVKSLAGRACLALLALALAGAACAVEVGGVKLDDKASVGGQELVLNGAGVRSRFMIKVYVGALYLQQKESGAQAVLAKNAPRRVTVAMLRDVSADTFFESLQDGLKANNAPAELDAIRKEVGELKAIFDAMKEAKSGQVITLDYTPAAGTQVGVNGTARGTIAGEAFNRALLKVWLGDKPVQDDLKKAMLGG